MKRRGAWLWTFGAGLAAALAFAPAALAQHSPTFAEDAGLVERGAYLARAADCMPCHTADPQKPYAGNRAFKTPFGVMYSVNITSDPVNGIGRWTFDQFKRALHDGIRADGAYLYPAMPFDAYTGITEDDLKALWAYVRRIPAIREERRENDLRFPFDVRLGLVAWRELFFEPAYFQPTPGRSEQWNRGAYLAQVLGHCSDCHTPRDMMGAVKQKEFFLGAEVDGYWAPAIDSQALRKNGWTHQTLTGFFTDGSAPGRTSVFGPMAEVVRDSLAFLTPADREALVTYLLDAPAPAAAPAPQAAASLSPEAFKQGARLYVDNCAPCHGSKGAGSEGVIPPLTGNPAVNGTEPYNVIMAMLSGVPAGGSYGPMPSFAGRLSDSQVAALANYVRAAWGNGAAPNATPAMVAAWRSAARVPDYGTQQDSAFDCPKVGGAPGASGPDPQAVAALTRMMQAGERQIHVLASTYQAADGTSSPARIVDALTAAYCPVVAASGAPDWQKMLELRRFTLQVAAAVSPGVAAVPLPDVPTIWATPAGTSLVARQPVNMPVKLTCPDADGKLVPKPLMDAAAALLGKVTPPVSADVAANLATTLARQSPTARKADVANALITAYCPQVVAQANASVADHYALLTGFGQQVIGTLQLLAPQSAAAK